MIKTYKNRKTTNRKKGSGRSETLTKSDKQRVRNKLKRRPAASCDDLINELELECSPETMRRNLHSMKFSFKNPDMKPMLTDEDKVLRFHWADFNKDCDFAPAIFSDESTFQLGFNQNKLWLPTGYNPQEKEIHPPKVNVYAAVGIFGPVGINVYQENMDSNLYSQILQSELIPNAKEIYDELGYEWVLVQDNARYHTSNTMEKFFDDNDIETLPLPAYSPDLNPVENLWTVLKHNVGKRNPQNLEELERFIYEEWDLIPIDVVSSCVSSINQRMCDVVSSRGQMTKY